jgi:uncharacterized LabA/DUF88 family protein
MANEGKAPRLAVLIDADNASHKIVDGLFEEVAKLGQATARRIYGNFASPNSQGWVEVLPRHAIIPQQQFAYTAGKNASDITMVIDAMDLLHSGRFEGFCLVSSDSDFTRLASRIREEGLEVYGIGEQKTPESFRQACTRFIYSENLLPARAAVEGSAPQPKPLEPMQIAEGLIKRAIWQMEGDHGWVHLGGLGTRLQNLASDFDTRTYGFGKLGELVRALPGIEVKETAGVLRARVRPAQLTEVPKPKA